MSAWRYHLGLAHALWLRDLMRLRHEKSRWFGLVAQPLLMWAILGAGMKDSFATPVAGLGAGLAQSADYARYFFPGVIMMTVLFTAIFSTISIIEDRHNGFLQAILVAPGSRAALVIGKLAGTTSLALIQVALLMAFAPVAGFSLAGIGFGLVALNVVLTCFGLTAIGLILAWVLPSSQAYHAVMSVVLLPLWVVSGALFPVPADANVLGYLMRANPLTYSVDVMRWSLAPAGDLPAASLLAVAVSTTLLTGAAVFICRRAAGGGR